MAQLERSIVCTGLPREEETMADESSEIVEVD
jgi:hypothetical protein